MTEQATPSLSQAQRLKRFSQEGKLTFESMSAIMPEEKKSEVDRLTFTTDSIRQYFPSHYTPKEMVETIVKLLKGWQRKRRHAQEH